MPSFSRLGQRSREASSARALPASKFTPMAVPPRRLVLASRNFRISGTTVDASNVVLASARVDLFRSGDGSLVATTTSDGAGAFAFVIPSNAGLYYVRAYKAGSPDVAGTSVETLVAVEI